MKPAQKTAKSTSKTDQMRAQREASANGAKAAKSVAAPKKAPAPAPSAPASKPAVAKPAPSAPAPKAPKAAPVAPESTPAETAGKRRDFTKEYNKKMRELGPARSRAVQLRRFLQRVEAMTAKMAGWAFEPKKGKGNLFATVVSSLGDATDAVGEAVTLLEQVPADWRPATARGAGGRAKVALAIGAVVDIREKQRESYADVLDGKDMVGLTVKTIGKGKVVCTTAKGERVVLPRGHLIVQGSESAPALDDEEGDEDEEAGDDE